MLEVKKQDSPEVTKHAHLALVDLVQEKDKKEKEKAKPKRIPEKNFMLAMMEAVEKDQNTMAEQQITDANATEEAVKLEANLYGYWMHELSVVTGEISEHDFWKHDPGHLKYLMSYYSTMSAEGQSMESQQDGAVQADQGQTTSDATNLQMKAQMVQGINNILSTLVNLLGRVTA